VPFIELQRESSVVEGDSVDSTLLMPGISWERRRIDDLLRPRSGRHLRFELRGALRGLLSDASFVQAIASVKKKPEPAAPTPEEIRAREMEEFRKATRRQVGLLVAGGILMLLIGAYAPASFMQHFIVFALSCFVGFQVIWNVSHALHTPLMAVTNAISGIIILGALLQVGSGNWLVVILAAVSILIATINIVGGFLVTRRMLAMFQRS